MASGIIVEEAPAYTLYKDTLAYVRKHVLPISHQCSRCKSTLTIDMPHDIYYRHDVFNQEYYAQRERYLDWKRKYSVLEPDDQHFNPNKWASCYHDPQLCITCPICEREQFVTGYMQAKCSDLAPVMAYYKALRDGPHQKQVQFDRIMNTVLFLIGVGIVTSLGWWLLW